MSSRVYETKNLSILPKMVGIEDFSLVKKALQKNEGEIEILLLTTN